MSENLPEEGTAPDETGFDDFADDIEDLDMEEEDHDDIPDDGAEEQDVPIEEGEEEPDEFVDAEGVG